MSKTTMSLLCGGDSWGTGEGKGAGGSIGVSDPAEEAESLFLWLGLHESAVGVVVEQEYLSSWRTWMNAATAASCL